MIIREVDNQKLYDTEYSKEQDEYWIMQGNNIVKIYTPNEFRVALYKNRLYIVEKDN